MDAVEIRTRLGPLLCHPGDGVTRRLLITGTLEQGVSRFMRRRLRAGMTFVDVGAHIGYLTVLASKIVGPAGRVFAVEPDPDNVELLERNVRNLASGNVTVFSFAALDRNGRASFKPHSDVPSWSHVTPKGKSEVPCYRLDEAISPPVDLVKIDAQGSDLLVVQGMSGFARLPLTVVEFSPSNPRAREELATYERLGYRVLALTWFGFEIPWARTLTLLQSGAHRIVQRSTGEVNLVLRP